MMNDDMELVREYATNQSAQAFETIVARHILLRKPIDDGSQTIGQNPTANGKTLLVFVNATTNFQPRLQKIIKKAQ